MYLSLITMAVLRLSDQTKGGQWHACRKQLQVKCTDVFLRPCNYPANHLHCDVGY